MFSARLKYQMTTGNTVWRLRSTQ